LTRVKTLCAKVAYDILFIMEGFSMKSLMIVAIASTYALAAGAQTTAPAADKAADTKAKQEMVKSATEGTAKGYGQAAAEGSAAAAKTKDMNKALPDKAAKQKSVAATTSSTAGKGYGQAAAEGSAKAAADTSPRKATPKPKLDSPAMKEASKP
jgi:hypothetical protein